MFSSSFDSAFRTIPFYKNHEFMLPAVGVNYESTKHKKLLLVGESCYMPKASFVHHNVNLWYDNYLCLGEKLTDSEKKCCDLRGARSDPRNKYRQKIDNAIKEVFPDALGNAFEEIASYNYFLRPADNGNRKTFRCTEMDCRESVHTFCKLIEILTPNHVVFTSKLAFDHAETIDIFKYLGCYLWDYLAKYNIGYSFTYHPSSRWWNRIRHIKTGSSDDYFRGLTSRQFFIDELRKNWLTKD